MTDPLYGACLCSIVARLISAPALAKRDSADRVLGGYHIARELLSNGTSDLCPGSGIRAAASGIAVNDGLATL